MNIAKLNLCENQMKTAPKLSNWCNYPFNHIKSSTYTHTHTTSILTRNVYHIGTAGFYTKFEWVQSNFMQTQKSNIVYVFVLYIQATNVAIAEPLAFECNKTESIQFLYRCRPFQYDEYFMYVSCYNFGRVQHLNVWKKF